MYTNRVNDIVYQELFFFHFYLLSEEYLHIFIQPEDFTINQRSHTMGVLAIFYTSMLHNHDNLEMTHKEEKLQKQCPAIRRGRAPPFLLELPCRSVQCPD